jgi:carboxyl-terminal processing protease
MIRIRTLAPALLVLLALVVPAIAPPATQAQEASRTFAQTGKTVGGVFLDYWNTHGGLAQQGYPISDELVETSPTDGKPYTVQYFERAVFEYHADAPPSDVLLSLLGVFFYGQKYPQGAPGQQPITAPGSVFFAKTGHRLGGTLQQYWQQHGGLAQQGYPISDEFTEVSADDGKPYTVQYFQRAVFEYHPEKAAPFTVLLSRLGASELGARYPAGAPAHTGLTLSERLDVFESTWQTVRTNYVYTNFRGLNWPAVHADYAPRVAAAPTDTDTYTLLADMIAKLNDGHSAFLSPSEAQEDDALQKGDLHFSGIGVLSQDLGGKVRVVYVIPGGPADKAGIHAFDLILAVDGTPLEHSEDAPHLIRGPEGTSVKLTVQSPGGTAHDITVVRAQVTFSFGATTQRLPGTNVAYVNLPTFDVFGISDQVAQQLTTLAASGPIDGVIIDVRQNGGGLLSELDGMLGRFINGGSAGFDLTLTGRIPDRIPAGQVLAATRNKPVVVLISDASESAAERFAAVMQDDHRATIIGTHSAGNTETVYPHDLPTGARLMLAQATWVRTDGRTSIEDKGVQPDVVLDVPWYDSPLPQDPQVLAAIAKIQGKP